MIAPRQLLLLTGDKALAGLLGPLVGEDIGFRLASANPAEPGKFAEGAMWDAGLADGEPALLAFLAAGFAAPIILLGAEEPLPGAAAALRKPLRLADLLSALSRLLAQPPAGDVQLGRFRLDASGKWLAGPAGGRVRLTEKETAIILHLRRAAPRAVGKEELLRHVWGYSPEVTTHTLETHVYRLRRKLGLAAAEGLVLTERDGYRLAFDNP
jgi:hypothetical protein